VTSIVHLCLYPFVGFTLLWAVFLKQDRRKRGLQSFVAFVSVFAGFYAVGTSGLDPDWSFVCNACALISTFVYCLIISILISEL